MLGRPFIVRARSIAPVARKEHEEGTLLSSSRHVDLTPEVVPDDYEAFLKICESMIKHDAQRYAQDGIVGMEFDTLTQIGRELLWESWKARLKKTPHHLLASWRIKYQSRMKDAYRKAHNQTRDPKKEIRLDHRLSRRDDGGGDRLDLEDPASAEGVTSVVFHDAIEMAKRGLRQDEREVLDAVAAGRSSVKELMSILKKSEDQLKPAAKLSAIILQEALDAR